MARSLAGAAKNTFGPMTIWMHAFLTGALVSNSLFFSGHCICIVGVCMYTECVCVCMKERFWEPTFHCYCPVKDLSLALRVLSILHSSLNILKHTHTHIHTH